jgi:uncharacterized protein YbaR (Trm112 family)
MDKNLLKNLVCPQCRHAVALNKTHNTLECDVCVLAYSIQDDIPLMLVEAAIPLNTESQ